MGISYYLKRQMEVKRRQMIRSAKDHGFTSKETIRYSQELDHLMNVYRRLTVKNSNKEEQQLSYMS
ncbi:Sporulation stage 0, Spo0E-like regulatory phosphatase [Evansella cellulosilytica DSM 2522]|uniref:Sporulation stage 0, Spo0E-like regulatory phosphatase n=1 Tax=Evansella cellulosilytica (strain ATCC 21833 / DSM 2522 / FERM P-1141 / JCM 9156 / N-4) TaxID=649639 RepID=E6TTL5_EVAC2|nr:Sporulation stage 0, Spo0E-like regulatory phosphatase [Evansella cellulosilytica DSM 2522]